MIKKNLLLFATLAIAASFATIEAKDESAVVEFQNKFDATISVAFGNNAPTAIKKSTTKNVPYADGTIIIDGVSFDRADKKNQKPDRGYFSTLGTTLGLYYPKGEKQQWDLKMIKT